MRKKTKDRTIVVRLDAHDERRLERVAFDLRRTTGRACTTSEAVRWALRQYEERKVGVAMEFDAPTSAPRRRRRVGAGPSLEA